MIVIPGNHIDAAANTTDKTVKHKPSRHSDSRVHYAHCQDHCYSVTCAENSWGRFHSVVYGAWGKSLRFGPNDTVYPKKF